MMKLKHFKSLFNSVVLQILLLLVVFTNLFSQEFHSSSQQSNSSEILKFFEFVIDKYVWLTQTVIEGDRPFIVTVKDFYCDTTHNFLRMDISYTKSYEELSSLLNDRVYKYDKSDSIYIIIENFQGHAEALTMNNLNTEPLTVSYLQNRLYALTYDHALHVSFPLLTKDTSKITFAKRDLYSINKHKNKISAQKNGYDIVFFTDYKSKSH